MAMTKSTHSGIVRLSRIVVKGHISIEVDGGHGWKEYTTLPHSDIDLSLGGMFIPCNQPPPSGDKVRITWTDPPFSKKTFRTTATLLETSGGIRLKFDQLSHADQHNLYDWMAHLEARLGHTPDDPDPAIRSSIWYTAAAAVSAGGLFLGAFAVLLQLVVGDRREYTTLPHSDIDLSLGGMFIPCNQPPPSGDKVRITWTDPPFSKKTFRTTATLLETSGGIRLKFDQLSHADQHNLYDWMAHLEARLGHTPEDTDPAVRSSLWYTAASNNT